MCNMLLPWKALNGTRMRTSQCTRGAEWKRHGLLAEEEREVTSRDLRDYSPHLEMATSFKYLGWVISAVDGDWLEVMNNLARARKGCSMMLRILSREGVAPRVSGLFKMPWSKRYCYLEWRPGWQPTAWERT